MGLWNDAYKPVFNVVYAKKTKISHTFGKKKKKSSKSQNGLETLNGKTLLPKQII